MSFHLSSLPHHYLAAIKRTKSLLPKSLFGRALMILVLPTILTQILVITIFYDRHWGNIQRHLSSSLAGEVAVVIDRATSSPSILRKEALDVYARSMDMDIHLLPLSLRHDSPSHHERFAQYVAELRKRIDIPFNVYERENHEAIRTEVVLGDELIQIDVGIKRLESSTTYIFVLWIVSSAALLTIIASVFLRNQIRPIARLASAAERFGMGQDIGNYRPHGAQEVRKAGKAFMVMRSRIIRQISTRTAMLTGISHDLRTPLTRLRLQLAMLGEHEDIQAMHDDITEMEVMLQEYLDYSRGNDDGAIDEIVDMASWMRGIIQGFTHTGMADITYSLPETIELAIRPWQLKRAIENVIGNALKYGHRCHVSMERSGSWLLLTVEDEGNGIPEDAMEDVFRPFTRLDDSRNSDTGGTGLGLAITRDIVQAHGGRIQMRNRYDSHDHITGLSVTILLPVETH